MKTFKKAILCLMITLVGLMCMACDKKDDNQGNNSSANKELKCEFKVPNSDKVLVPGKEFAYDNTIGETTGYNESNSCYFEGGVHKMYSFNGYAISTNPTKDGDVIAEISVTGKDIKTPAGIGVGSTVAELDGAYGNKEYVTEGIIRKYEFENDTYVYFTIANDAVKMYGYGVATSSLAN